MSSYADGSDFLARYDARLIGDLVRDDGVKESPDSLPTNAKLLMALADANADVITAIAVGGRYTIDQMDADNLAPTALQFLQRLECDIALIYIKRRRGKYNDKDDGPLDKQNQEKLKALQDGKAILLGVDDDRAKASVIGMAQPELIPVERRKTIRFQCKPYYPTYPYPSDQRFGRGGN